MLRVVTHLPGIATRIILKGLNTNRPYEMRGSKTWWSKSKRLELYCANEAVQKVIITL